MLQKFSNNGTTLTAIDLNFGDTTVTVLAGTGDLFPEVLLASGDYFLLTVESSTGVFEILKVTDHILGADSMTIVRAQEDTTQPPVFAAGSRIELRTTKGTMENFIQRSATEVIDGGTY